MDKKARNIFLIIVGSLVGVGLLLYGLSFLETDLTPKVDPNHVQGNMNFQQLAERTGCTVPPEGSSLDDFAKCIKDSGALFYGAFWCSHCKDQKDLFGSSAQYLPYIECSTPDGGSQLQVCRDANIQVYPTWVFKPKT